MDFSNTGPYVEFITPNFENATTQDIIDQLQYAQEKTFAAFEKQDIPVFTVDEGGWPFVLWGDDEMIKDILNSEKGEKQNDFKSGVIKVDGKGYLLSRDYNGSYHINVTLPVAKKNDFFPRHHAAMKALQWMSPLFIAAWGQPDMFSYGDYYHFTEGSFRMMTNFHSRMGSVDLDGPSEEILKKQKVDLQTKILVIGTL